MEPTITPKPTNKKILLISIVAVFLLITAGIFFVTLRQSPQKSAPDDSQNMIHEKGKLVRDFPELPTYPGATIESSSQRIKMRNTGQDLHAVWTSKSSVKEVMDWYMDNLEKHGWEVIEPDDRTTNGEQVAQITHQNYIGYIAAEDERGTTEIVVDLRNTNGK